MNDEIEPYTEGVLYPTVSLNTRSVWYLPQINAWTDGKTIVTDEYIQMLAGGGMAAEYRRTGRPLTIIDPLPNNYIHE